MTQRKRRKLWLGLNFLLAFLLWTWLLRWVDVQPIGPNGSVVGMATINGFVHRLTGTCMPIYTITDWLGLIPVGIGLGFAMFGLVQWIRRKHIRDVDGNILILGAFYLLMLLVYLVFETVVINYRPILISGFLEVSYPSSTTLLVLCVIPTTIWQVRHRIRNVFWRRVWVTLLIMFMLFMVIGRLLAGVHWLSDIVGGVLLSVGFVLLYDGLC